MVFYCERLGRCRELIFFVIFVGGVSSFNKIGKGCLINIIWIGFSFMYVVFNGVF